MEENMTSANSNETVKIKTHHARIVVDGTADKPYYSIEWFDPIKKEYYLGYSSYYIGNVFNWLSECFEIVETPKTNADRIRAMSDEELAEWMAECNAYREYADASQWLPWLQQPAEPKESFKPDCEKCKYRYYLSLMDIENKACDKCGTEFCERMNGGAAHG